MTAWCLLFTQIILLVWAILASSSGLLHSHLSIRIIHVLCVSRTTLPVSFCLELFLCKFKLVLGNLQMISCAEKMLEVGTFLSVRLVVVETQGCWSNDLVEILWLLGFIIIFEATIIFLGAIKNVILLKVVSLILIGECWLWYKTKSFHLVLFRNAAHEAILKRSNVLRIGLLRDVPVYSWIAWSVLHGEVELWICLLLLVECRRHKLIYLVIRLFNLLP